jgi:hypothetical protein
MTFRSVSFDHLVDRGSLGNVVVNDEAVDAYFARMCADVEDGATRTGKRTAEYRNLIWVDYSDDETKRDQKITIGDGFFDPRTAFLKLVKHYGADHRVALLPHKGRIPRYTMFETIKKLDFSGAIFGIYLSRNGPWNPDFRSNYAFFFSDEDDELLFMMALL